MQQTKNTDEGIKDLPNIPDKNETKHECFCCKLTCDCKKPSRCGGCDECWDGGCFGA